MSLKFVGVPQAFLKRHEDQINGMLAITPVGEPFAIMIRENLSKLAPMDMTITAGSTTTVYRAIFTWLYVKQGGRDEKVAFPVDDGPDQIVAWYQRNKVKADVA